MRALAAILLLLLSFPLRAEVLIVVGKDSPIEKLSQAEVTNLFLARSRFLADGERAYPLELSGQNDETDFYYRISGKNDAQINSYWTTLIFTGKGKPPRVYEQYQGLVEALTENPRAIAYLSPDRLSDDVKVVFALP